MALIKKCACGCINESNEALCRKCGNDILFETPVDMPDDEYDRVMALQKDAAAHKDYSSPKTPYPDDSVDGTDQNPSDSGIGSFDDLFGPKNGEEKRESSPNSPVRRPGGGRIIVTPTKPSGNGNGSQPSVFKFCRCGETNSPDRHLCSKCGASLDAVAAMTLEKHKELTDSLNRKKQPNSRPQPSAQASAPAPGKYLLSLDNMCVVQPDPSGQKSVLGRSSADRNVRGYLESRKGVSRNHANIWHDGKNLFIEDIGSTNGTFIDNRRIEPNRAYALKIGNQLTLGNPRSDSDKIAIFSIR